jgi:serine protease inhibitor
MLRRNRHRSIRGIADVILVTAAGLTACGGSGAGVDHTVNNPASLPAALAEEQFVKTMDHPFLYAIRDDDMGALLFIGTLMDPSK